MNKNDFEVWIFHHLMTNVYAGLNHYEISLKLKIPESKVKRLHYEADLKYGQQDDEANFKALYAHLKKVHFNKNADHISFVIEDMSLRKFLDSKLKSMGRYSDSSFNREIVSISLDDLSSILNLDKQNKNQIDDILKLAKSNKELSKLSLGKLLHN